jgi:cysteinyl-tRNA synthetase
MTTIRLRNTKTRKVEEFVPIDRENVRMYVCGPTVYDRAHLGNARPVIVFDVLYRLLRHVYGAEHVTYVRNFTDVDDKINAEALRRQQAGAPGTIEELIHQRTEETIAWYHADMDALGALRPNHEPRATDYIGQMIGMIEGLIASGHAYARDGHVLFRVRSYKGYGRLSGRSVDDMIAGARVEVAPFKEDPMDFVLWKPSDADLPGWDSPWGRGRPGWHIECSAMSHELLGESFDIHGGGIDLQFPHHENEIAQSACAHPHGDFAKVWMHNEMLMVEGKKMSKSLGNFFTVRDLLDGNWSGGWKVPGEVIRFVFLSTHYSKPMDWTEEKARQAEATLRKWRTMTFRSKPDVSPPIEVVSALSDDMNTHAALTALHRFSRLGNGGALLAGAKLLGLLTPELSDWFRFGEKSVAEDPRIDAIQDIRVMARKRGNYAISDQMRSDLLDAGVAVFDYKDSSTGYFEPDFLARWLVSKAWAAFKAGDREKAQKYVDLAREAGVSVHLEDDGVSAVTGHDEQAAFAYFEKYISLIHERACKILQKGYLK